MKLFWTVVVLSLGIVFAACSDDGAAQKDLCENVACAGVCNPNTGECLSACLGDNDCPGGVCVEGACVADLCKDVTCARGVCAAATGECVNAEVCTNETEATDCVAGYGCYGQRCVDEATYCADHPCDRGVCSISAKACVDADSCSVDAECLEGNLCQAGACVPNVCNADMVTCARGVCEPQTGNCVNASSCSSLSECVDNTYCVQGACVGVAQACASCTGNQLCNYFETTSTVACVESPAGCRNTYDCLDDRVCDNGACVAPGQCDNDALEPNDASAPTAVTEGRLTAATICGSDEDAFGYDVSTDALFSGTLIAVVAIDPEHVGRGELRLELLNEAGTVQGTATTVDGVGRVTATIGNLNRGTYRLVVKASGAMSAAGIDYRVVMDVIDNTTLAACGGAAALAATQTGNTLSGASVALRPKCATTATPAEDIYLLELTQETIVTLNLVPSNGANLGLSVRTTCEIDASEIACVDNSAGQEQYIERLSPGTYYVVVQAGSTTGSGAYTLTYESELPICTSADNTCADINVASVCNADGTGFVTQNCSLGCDGATGRCKRTEGDVCYTAIDATNGYSGTIDWEVFENDFAPERACVPGTGSTVGEDVAYFVNLPAMSVLRVYIESDGYDDVSLYLTRNCDALAQTCFAGVDDGYDGEILYANTSNAADPLYVIADAERYNYSTASIEISIEPIICQPRSAACVGDVLEVCNATGTGYQQTTCGFGCNGTTLKCNLPPNDVCGAGAVDVSAGGTFVVDTTQYANDYELTSANCTGYRTAGRDAVFRVQGTPGDIVYLELTANYDSALYVLTDCSDFGTCLGGEDNASRVKETVTFVLPDTNPVYVVVDGYSSSSQGTATLSVNVETPDCFSPGQSLNTCKDANTLSYCNYLGLTTDYACAGGCANGACGDPSGDVCWDVIPIAVGGRYVGDFDDVDNRLNPGSSCILASDPETDGPDTIFAIDAQAGETIEARLTTTSSSTAMYFLSSCDDNTCQHGVLGKNIEFFAAQAGTYYLVVDSTSVYDSASFTLEVRGRLGGLCQPSAGICNGSTLSVCSADGTSFVDTINCPAGCNAGFCEAPAVLNDTCATAMPISGRTKVRQSWGPLKDDYDPTYAGCTGEDMEGGDAVYAVTLGAGQSVKATVQSFDTYNSPAIYFMTDCTDATTTCLEGATASDDTLTYGYYSAMGGTVYMVVDTEYATSDPFIVDIEVADGVCTPGTEICLDADTVGSCNDYHLYDETVCSFGCDSGTCLPAPNDLCAGAIDISMGGSFRGDIDVFSADYNPGSSGCTGYAAAGKDSTYVVNAPVGDVIKLELDANFDSALYVVTNCGALSSCLAGSDSGNPEEVIVVSTGQPLYVIVDAYLAGGSGDYTLTASISTPICAPGSHTCSDGTNLEYCDATGTTTEIYPCPGTCTVGASSCSTGATCASAQPISMSGTINGTWYPWQSSLTTSDYGACTGYDAAGPEVVYSVALTAGQTLSATLTATTSSQDIALYIVTDCANIEGTCLDGSDNYGPESVSYTASSDTTVFLVADNYDTRIEGEPTYSLAVNIQ